MGDRLRIVVIGLLEETAPAGADVVTIPHDADVAAELASRAKGATRETMLFVVADTGEPSVDRLPDTLARGGFRAVVLAGLPGAVGTLKVTSTVSPGPASAVAASTWSFMSCGM